MHHADLFLQDATLADHHAAQSGARPAYLAALLLLLAHRVEISPAARARALAAAWARRDDDLSRHLLDHPLWTLTEVVRAVQLLDAGRQARALQRRIDRLVKEGRARPRRLGALRSRVLDLQREGVIGSLSGALSRHVRRWVRTIPATKLEFYALTFPLQPWRTLADLCHLDPADFQLPWFLPVAFGAAPPPETTMAAYTAATPAELPAVAARLRAPYGALRTRVPPKDLPESVRAEVASYESLDTVLWYYEELRCAATDRHLTERLSAGEEPALGYGKLMERLFACRDLKAPFWELLLPIAERRIGDLRLPIDPPVVVLGDASSSMMVAIRTATIIGSLLTVLSRADLRFFNQALITPKVVPRSIADVLRVTDTIQATGSTAPAAALWPSVQRDEHVRSLLLVTDEEENTDCQGMRFGAMLERYQKGRPPVQVVFMSFIGQTAAGQMATDLKARGIPYRQFRLDRNRPDLTRLDEFMGHLSLSGSLFQERLETVTEWAAQAPLAGLPARVEALLRAGAETAAAPGAETATEGGPAAPAGDGKPGLWQRLRALVNR